MTDDLFWFEPLNRPFSAVCSVSWPMNASRSRDDLVLIQTSLLFSCKCKLVGLELLDLHNKISEVHFKQGHLPPQCHSKTRSLSRQLSNGLLSNCIMVRVLLTPPCPRGSHWGVKSSGVRQSKIYKCHERAYGPERIKRVSLSISDLKRSDFLKHLAIKNCEKAFLKNI